jgi:ABC-type transport system involved in multi-copper enzyme maturation permease subunit
MKNSMHTHRTPILALTRLTLLESWRGRSARFLFLALIAIQLIAGFAVEMAVTESVDLRLTVSGFLYRFCLIFALGVGMISSVVREQESGFVYVLLAHPLSRLQYVLGRILGYSITAFIAALSVMLVLAIWVPLSLWGSLLLWAVSLWLELIVTGSVALFLALGLRNMVGSMVVWLAFYVLARILDVARTMAASPIGQDPNGIAALAGQGAFQIMGWVIPPLGTFTRSEWLLGHVVPSWESCFILGAWALAYSTVCTVAAAIDFYRYEI